MAYQHHFELYMTGEQLTEDQWFRLYQSLLQHGGLFSTFQVTFKATDNVIRFFISSRKNLGLLSNTIEGLLLQPVKASELAPPSGATKAGFINFVAGGNLLDLKEAYAVKKAKDLEWGVFNVRAMSSKKAAVRADLYFKLADGRWAKTTKTMLSFPSRLLAVDFMGNTRYLKKALPVYLDIEKAPAHALQRQNR